MGNALRLSDLTDRHRFGEGPTACRLDGIPDELTVDGAIEAVGKPDQV